VPRAGKQAEVHEADEAWDLASQYIPYLPYSLTFLTWSYKVYDSPHEFVPVIESKKSFRMAFIFTCGTHTFSSLLQGYEPITVQCQNCGNFSGKVFKRW